MKHWFSALSLVIALTLAAAAAATTATTAAAQDRVQEINGITFVSGGIGRESREDLAQREQSYNFKLVTLLEGSGRFVSAAQISLSSATGSKLLDYTTEGPILLMSLSPGSYEIAASFRGLTRLRKFQVRANRLTTEYLRWPADPTQDVVPAPIPETATPTPPAKGRQIR